MCSIRLKHFQYHFRPQCTSVTNRQTHDPSDKPNHYHSRLKSGPANWKWLRRQRSDCRRSDVDARRDWRHRNRSDGFRQFQPHHHLQDLQPPATNITRLDVGVGQFQLSIYTAHNHRTATNGWPEHPACKKISPPVMSRSFAFSALEKKTHKTKTKCVCVHHHQRNQAQSEYKHSLTFRIRHYMHLQCIRL